MSSKMYRNRYTVSEFFRLSYCFLLTKLCFPKAKLICRPFYLRGKKGLSYKAGLNIGYNCRFDLLNTTKKTLFLGYNCEFNDNCHIVAVDEVRIGNNFLCASHVFISDCNHGCYSDRGNCSFPTTSPRERPLSPKPVIIGDNVWVGENVVILPGVTIGNGCIIGANSVVTKSIPDNSIAVGSPAKVIKSFFNDGWKKV